MSLIENDHDFVDNLPRKSQLRAFEVHALIITNVFIYDEKNGVQSEMLNGGIFWLGKKAW